MNNSKLVYNVRLVVSIWRNTQMSQCIKLIARIHISAFLEKSICKGTKYNTELCYIRFKSEVF